MELWIFILVYGSVIFSLFILLLRWPQLCSLGQSTQHFARGGFGWHTCCDSSSCLEHAQPISQDGLRSLPAPEPFAVPSPAPLGPCLGMALPIRLPLSFSGFLPEISSPTAFSKVAWFFLAQWYLFNQVSVTEDRFLFESVGSSRMNPLGCDWVVEEMMLLSLSE